MGRGEFRNKNVTKEENGLARERGRRWGRERERGDGEGGVEGAARRPNNSSNNSSFCSRTFTIVFPTNVLGMVFLSS